MPGARRKFETTYQNADGTSTTNFATEAVNYQSPSGKWLPVDNHLIVGSDGMVHNVANSWRVSFGSLDQGIAVDTGRAALGWKPVGSGNVAPVVDPDGVSLRYVDAWPGVDLVYRVSGSHIAEVMEVKSPSSATTFAFDVIGGAFTSNGAGEWSASGALAADGVRVAPPRSVDAAGRGVDDHVTSSLTPATAGIATGIPAIPSGRAAAVSQRASFVVDPVWLASLPASQFPIDVDPPINIGEQSVRAYSSDGIVDTTQFLVGNPAQAGAPNKRWRSVVSFDISSIYGANVDSAHLQFLGQPQGTGTHPLYGYVASIWGWQNPGPDSSRIIWDTVQADTNNYVMFNSNALATTYNQWARTSSFGALLLTGDETAGLYTIVGGNVQLSLTYDRFPTAPSGFSSVSSGYKIDWGFSTPGSDPEVGPLGYAYWVSVGGAPNSPFGMGPTGPGTLLLAQSTDPGNVDLGGYLGQTITVGVDWTDGYGPNQWTGETHVGRWSTTFVPTNRPPTGFGTLPTAPANGTTLHPLAVPFSVPAPSPADLDGEPVAYQVFWCNDSACQPASRTYVNASVSGSSIVASYTFAPAGFGQTFYWGLRATDGHGGVTDSAVWSFHLDNALPTVTQTSPAPGALYETLPTLVATITDADAATYGPESVNYRFTIRSAGGTGLLAASPWQPFTVPVFNSLHPELNQVHWTTPAGLVSNLGYEWMVEVQDANSNTIPGSPWRPLSLVGHLGADSVSPMQAAGPVSINLATGNVFFGGSGDRSINTAGGAATVGLAYNSRDRATLGFAATYYDDSATGGGTPGDGIPQPSEIRLGRVDPLPAFNWHLGSPAVSIPVGAFKVRWKGVLRVPSTGWWELGGGHQEQMTIQTAPVGQPLATVYNSSVNVPLSSPAAFTSASPNSWTAGQLIQVQIDYTRSAGLATDAFVELRARVDPSVGMTGPWNEMQVDQGWFTTGTPPLPQGWTLSADTGIGATWTSAQVLDVGVLLTAVDGSQAFFTQQTTNGATTWKSPDGVDDLLVVKR